MRASDFLFATLKETPSDADIASSQLMLRAGLIRKLASGLYTWLPMGLKVLRKVENIVREEMIAAGAMEVAMPMVQPAELWQESGRVEAYGPELLRFQDRHNREFVLGPTHEEVITDLARNQLQSYKQVPINFFQIQNKFRDEIRPRFGVMRAREFLMKDAYSFHTTQESLQTTYDAMYQAYTNIFNRIGLEFRAVLADTGSIGGEASHEFHVLADSGEDAIAFSDTSDYAANVELAEAICNDTRPEATQEMADVATPSMPTCEEVANHLNIPLATTVKTLIVQGVQTTEQIEQGQVPLVALVIRGDHSLNDIKAEKIPAVLTPMQMATEEQLKEAGLVKGFIGVDLAEKHDIPVYVDRSAAVLADFVTGANKVDFHTTGVNWERDAQITQVVDIREVVEGDASPDGQGKLNIKRGIEVGHIFQLGTKYAEALNCHVNGEDGKPTTLTMGCYGIGVSRVVAAAIEQNHDDNGIIWPQSIAPFDVAIVPMTKKNGSEEVIATAEALYEELKQAGLDVIYDDRKERPGFKFADLELVGIPHRVVVSERNLANNQFEYRARNADENELLSKEALLDKLIG